MKNVEKAGLDREVVDDLSEIFAATSQVTEVVISGSLVKGNFTIGSDIDLVVKGKNIDIDTVVWI
jgi:predicted nucleotidyltransferase